jgi:gamma-glutamyl-gamma-aminobutyrate hydrolase PuuD
MARVGVTQRVVDLGDRGERRDALDQAWATWIGAGGDIAVPIPNRLSDVAGFVRALELDALVLSGGNDLAHLPGATNVAPERDATEDVLLTEATARRIPVLAVCRGMQMLVTFWGGTPARVDHHVACHHPIDRTVSPWPLRAGPVNSFHDWGVHKGAVGATLEVLATAPDGTVEAVAHRTLPHVGIMWHPERADPDPVDRELLARLIDAAR